MIIIADAIRDAMASGSGECKLIRTINLSANIICLFTYVGQ